MLTFTTMRSPIGTLRLYAAAEQLVGVYLPGRANRDALRRHCPPEASPGCRPARSGPSRLTGVLDRAVAQLAEYFAGQRREFSLGLALRGTSFQRLVWESLQRIPYGETCGYGELARALGRPAASRAVGAANGRNPLSIIVPCHRLIGADGGLTGYAGGLAAKRWLLDLERAGKPGPDGPGRSRR